MRNPRFNIVGGRSQNPRKPPFSVDVNFGEEAYRPVLCRQARLVLGLPRCWPDPGCTHYGSPPAGRSHSQPRNGGRSIARPRLRRRGQVPGPRDRSPSQVSNGQPSSRARAEAVSPRRRRSRRRASSAGLARRGGRRASSLRVLAPPS